MSSLLRYDISSASAVPITQRPTSQYPPAKKQKMSTTATYYLAHTARGKLSKEAARGDHDLRLLVGHANLLDGLMLELATAEQEQESWFNQTVKSAAKDEPKQSQRISWADQHTIVEEEMYEEDSDSDSEDEGEEIDMAVTVRKVPAQSMQITISKEEEDEDMEPDDFDEELSLQRTASHSPAELSPPELMHEDSDSFSDSDDEPMPPSPRDPELLISEKQRQAIATTSLYHQSPSKPIDSASLFQQDSQQVAIAAY